MPIAVAHSPMPYIDAIGSNSVGRVSLLLALGANPNRFPDINLYPYIASSLLQLAAQNNAAEVAEVLLAAGANLHTRIDMGTFFETPLHAASHRGKWEVVKVLLDAGADSNKANSLGVTALFWPVWFNEVRTVELLLAAGSDPNELTMVGGYRDSTRWGMKEFFQVHTDAGETPLHVTTYCNAVGAAQALLDGGAVSLRGDTEEIAGRLKAGI